MTSEIYSVRMRASSFDRHVSGAERIVKKPQVDTVCHELLLRALNAKECGADKIICQVEKINAETIMYARLPDLQPFRVNDFSTGRSLAQKLLVQAGVQPEAAIQALSLLARGAAPGGGVMRGAVLMDSTTGERLEKDQAKGVRVSSMDLIEKCRHKLSEQLNAFEWSHKRVLEAIILAGKVTLAPGVIAEVCWSDEPDYLAGYVCSSKYGYQRISVLKSPGDNLGGRVFFVDADKVAINALIKYLTRQPVLFNQLGAVCDEIIQESIHE
jgi:6-carboxyhexanoate--CoA ligase